MRRLLKVCSAVLVIGTLALFINGERSVNAAATDDIARKCQYDAQQGVNPDNKTMNCLLTETALANNVPPEIVKAIAEKESGGWKHFDDNGNAIVTEDNGIGIMQITNQPQYDQNRLKNDIVYNIQTGIEVLDKMFKRTDLPTINYPERDILEHWYFAIMAYNGIKPVNSPVVQATGNRNTNAYQELVYKHMRDYGLVATANLPFKLTDFDYDSSSNENIKFTTMRYHFNEPFTKTTHSFQKGQQVSTTTAINLRERATTSSRGKATLLKGETLTITGPFQYEEDATRKNHFVWYPVKRSNGTTGYVASSYLKLQFKDIPSNHYAKDYIYYLVDRGILKGIGNDQFGIEQPLTRWQAVLLITRANNIALDNRPNPGFKDVPKDHLYYKEIAAAVAEGLFQGMPGKRFNPNATLTRAQMAVILQRLYQFPAATAKHPFTDLTASWYADQVARLYASKITDGLSKTTFGPQATVTREQFATFMVRSMDENYRLQ